MPNVNDLAAAMRGLEKATNALKRAHAEQHDANRGLLVAKRDLAEAEARHTLAGLKGSNAEARKAELIALTAGEAVGLANAESLHRDAQLSVTLAELDYRLARELVASARAVLSVGAELEGVA